MDKGKSAYHFSSANMKIGIEYDRSRLNQLIKREQWTFVKWKWFEEGKRLWISSNRPYNFLLQHANKAKHAFCTFAQPIKINNHCRRFVFQNFHVPVLCLGLILSLKVKVSYLAHLIKSYDVWHDVRWYAKWACVRECVCVCVCACILCDVDWWRRFQMETIKLWNFLRINWVLKWQFNAK